MPSPKLLIFIPTYNEAENAERLCRELSALELGADILFCDDGSPDGTGEIVDELAREFSHVRAIHRSGKLGIGSAHQEGIRYAYAHGYETLVTMDCDFTHQPADVERLLEIAHSSGQAVCIGSRYMKRDSLPGWNPMRRSLTYLGHFLTVNLLQLPQDATGALRVYQLGAIPRELFDRVRSCGYSFFFESLFVLHRNGFAIEEMPIALPARTYGSSKMSLARNCAKRLAPAQALLGGRSSPRELSAHVAAAANPRGRTATAGSSRLGHLLDPRPGEKPARLFLCRERVSAARHPAQPKLFHSQAFPCLVPSSFTPAVVRGRWIRNFPAKCESPPSIFLFLRSNPTAAIIPAPRPSGMATSSIWTMWPAAASMARTTWGWSNILPRTRSSRSSARWAAP